MGKGKSKVLKSKKVAIEFKELLLQNGFVTTVPGPTGEMKVVFYNDGIVFFVPVNPLLRDSMLNTGFLATMMRALYGPSAYFYPVHGDITISAPKSHGGKSGKTRFDAMENLLRWRSEQLSKGVSTVNSYGAPTPVLIGDVQSADASIVSG